MTRPFPIAPLAAASLGVALSALLAAAPAAAQEDEAPGLLEQGADLMLQGLLEEVTPPLAELAGIAESYLPTFQLLAREMGPALSDVIGRIDSIAYYEPPVIAPNGDIVIRRRADAPAWVPPAPEASPEPGGEPGAGPERKPDPDEGGDWRPDPKPPQAPPEEATDL